MRAVLHAVVTGVAEAEDTEAVALALSAKSSCPTFVTSPDALVF